MLQEGIQAPNFTALDQFEVSHTLSGYKGSFVILYFTPKIILPAAQQKPALFAIRGKTSEIKILSY